MVDMDKRVKQYVEIRDKLKEFKKEYEEKIAPYQKAKDDLAALILKSLNASKAESMRTIHGTAYKTLKQSCSIADKEAFREFVIENEAWELVDMRANATAVADWAQEHKDKNKNAVFPPGVNYSAFVDIGVRKN